MARWRYGYKGRKRKRPIVVTLLLGVGLLVGLGAALLTVLVINPSNASPSHDDTAADCDSIDGCATPAAGNTAVAPATPTPPTPTVTRADPALLAQAPPAPLITGEAAMVLEESCGVILYELNPQQRFAPASLAKIATAIVAVDHADVSAEVTVYVDGIALWLETGSTIMGLVPGDMLTMQDLLYGLLLPSGNDAALAIAEYVSGDADSFLMLMNREVRQLRLRNTRFQSPDGRDAENQYTSAYDITMLARELLRRPELAEIVRTDVYQPDWDGPELTNSNPLLALYPDAIGVKVGYTIEAKDVIVAAAEREGRQIIVTVLRSDDVVSDATALLDWAFDSTPQLCPELAS